MKKIYFVLLIFMCILSFTSCKDGDTVSPFDSELNDVIITDFSSKVAQASYSDLQSHASQLYSDIQTLKDNKTNENLSKCRVSWKAARSAWEQTESFLFGPVSTESIDPRIDTWPVNFADLDDQLSSENEFSDEYINDLDDALKGFHPIEYIIFGKDGDKDSEDLTTRELQYLEALGKNLKTLTSEVSNKWNPESSDNYFTVFATAGKGSAVYATQVEAFDELVAAMADICGEVGESKMQSVYEGQDPTQEESPFSKNSITDFTNNIKGIENVYKGKYSEDGKGLEDLVKKYNLSLDNELKTKLSNAITALNSITMPFGEAIVNQKPQVEAAIDAIAELKEVLNDDDDLTSTDLAGFVKLHSK